MNASGTQRALKVAVLAGGATHEHDISIKSAHHLASGLRERGHDVTVLELGQHLIENLKNASPDAIWPMVHGGVGEDGALQTLLDMLGTPYVGSGPLGAHTASYKPAAKAVAQKSGVSTPAWVTLPRALFSQIGASDLVGVICRSLTFPLVVKPSGGGSSLGVTRVTSDDELRVALIEAFSYADTALIEQFVAGREVAVSLADTGEGLRALPLVEIEMASGDYDYAARYQPGRSVFYVPARLSEAETQALSDAALTAAKAMGLRHICRIDMILDDAGTPWLIDANVVPGMTDMSLFPQAAEACGSVPALLDEILRSTLT